MSPRVGEVIRRASFLTNRTIKWTTDAITGLLKLSDETDLDLLNTSMESMVEQFQDELLPVATELTGRLVGVPCFWWWYVVG